MKQYQKYITWLAIAVYAAFIIVSLVTGCATGKKIAGNFASFAITMLKILPCAFILIGLFEVWVKKETVQKHLGNKSNWLGYVWSILLAGTTIGGLYVALPVAHTLYGKGARLSFIFTYIAAAGICRIPMTVFEASFVGLKFTAIRLAISVPLIIVSSICLGSYLERKGYTMEIV